jgi:hypothetical protein
MLKTSYQTLHCQCGAIYLMQSRPLERYLGQKTTCPKCGRVPHVEQLKPKSEFAKPRSHGFWADVKKIAPTFVQKQNILAVVAVVGVVGIVASGARTTPQITQLPPLSAPLNLSSEGLGRPPISLANGTNIIPPEGISGLGKLKVDNGTTRDAAIKLVDSVSGKTYRFVYVRAGNEVNVEKISPCTCTLKFSMGTDWDQASQKFLRNPSFSKFSEPLNYKEITENSGVKWMEYRVTLHPVPQGRARTTRIDESDFQN